MACMNLAGFIKRTFIHSYTQNRNSVGLVVLEKKIFFYVFPIVSLWELINPEVGPFLTPEAWLAGFINRTALHCYTQDMKALVLEIFLCFSNDASEAWPVWTRGAWLAGFIKRTFIHSYTQNRNTLGLVVLEKKIFYVFPIVSLWEQLIPRVGPFLTPGAWLAGFIKRTFIHSYTQNGNTLDLVVLEKIFLMFFPMTPLGRGLYGTQGQGWQDL